MGYDIWPLVTKALQSHGIECRLNVAEGSMTVTTTNKTFDPYIIIKSRDFIKLLSRSVPLQHSVKVLQDEVTCNIIKINDLVQKKKRFRLISRLKGPNGSTLKALELLTNSHIFIMGNTVSVIGAVKNIEAACRVIIECFKNIHPIYHLKSLIAKRKLMSKTTFLHDNLEQFLPKFNKNTKRAHLPNLRTKNSCTRPKPKSQQSKIDIQLESGEYFMKK